MRRIIKTLFALLGSIFMLMLGIGLLGTLLSVRMTIEAFSPAVTGLVMSAYFGGLAAGALRAGLIIQWVGHIRAFAVFAAVMTAAVVLHGLYVDAVIWGLLRALAGFSAAGLYMVIESWLNERAAGAHRGRVFSVYQLISYTGLGLGQFLIDYRPPEQNDLFLVAAGIFALCLVPVSMTRAIHPQPIERTRLAIRAVRDASPLGLVACHAAGLINGAAFALAPVFVIDTGADTTAVAAFMGAMILGGIVLQYPLGHLSDTIDRRKILASLNLALVFVASAFLLYSDAGLTGLALLAAAFGGLSFTSYPMAVAHINDRLKTDDFVGASAAMLFSWGTGATLGPIIGGAAMKGVGSEGLFLFTSVVAFLVGVFALLARGESVPRDEQSTFVAMARSTSVILEMDPRAHAHQPQMDWIDELAETDAGPATESVAGQ